MFGFQHDNGLDARARQMSYMAQFGGCGCAMPVMANAGLPGCWPGGQATVSPGAFGADRPTPKPSGSTTTQGGRPGGRPGRALYPYKFFVEELPDPVPLSQLVPLGPNESAARRQQYMDTVVNLNWPECQVFNEPIFVRYIITVEGPGLNYRDIWDSSDFPTNATHIASVGGNIGMQMIKSGSSLSNFDPNKIGRIRLAWPRKAEGSPYCQPINLHWNQSLTVPVYDYNSPNRIRPLDISKIKAISKAGQYNIDDGTIGLVLGCKRYDVGQEFFYDWQALGHIDLLAFICKNGFFPPYGSEWWEQREDWTPIKSPGNRFTMGMNRVPSAPSFPSARPMARLNPVGAFGAADDCPAGQTLQYTIDPFTGDYNYYCGTTPKLAAAPKTVNPFEGQAPSMQRFAMNRAALGDGFCSPGTPPRDLPEGCTRAKLGQMPNGDCVWICLDGSGGGSRPDGPSTLTSGQPSVFSPTPSMQRFAMNRRALGGRR